MPRDPELSLLPHLGRVCRTARAHAGLRRLDVAYHTRRSETTIKRFEDGENWPRDPDAVIRTYAEHSGTTALELWSAAVAAWRGHLDGGAGPPEGQGPPAAA